ncbi:polyisoprenoid-binding protein YceI [Sphingobacterium allocomposti]|uniref:Polyisoprenoid-binding protein YceI n=1 Tax=Sphingobacterium allocomposti TaxID=415956 RepID=A0A5S5DAD6_9SPHI|nr:YceI family protein [Sphingobacterium composti Yoo et al. 2007 non Ten et al. 2007]TYP92960.1 polyisoprenoid-binding protein YceI [Sphingobacterium composti Yoo et al. 2007 non Ten et al. 2007]
MKRTSLLFLLLIVSATAVLAQKATYTVDTKTTSLTWAAKKVVGGHEGTILLQQGTIQVEKGKIVGGEFTVDMESLVCTDAPKVAGHLKNEDFFDVSTYPKATFVITRVDYKQAVPTITGNLTIKNITKPISFPARVVSLTDKTLEAEAQVKVNRLDFDIKYRSASIFSGLGDRAIDDEFTLNILLKGAR